MFRRRRTTLSRVAAIAAIAVCVLVVGPAPRAVAQVQPDDAPSTPLPSGFDAMVADAATGRLFISSSASNVVSVLDAGGQPLTTLAVPGARGMVVHDGRLYVVSSTGSIAVFDATSYADLGSIGSGLGTPHTLAWAGGRLWTSAGECSNTGAGSALAAVDPLDGSTTNYDVLPDMQRCPALVASPTDEHALLGWDSLYGTTLDRLDVSSGHPALAARAENAIGGTQAVFEPDGSAVLACRYDGVYEYTFDGLTPTGRTYPITTSINGVALHAASGQVAVGQGSNNGADVFVAPGPGAPPSWSYDFGDLRPQRHFTVPNGVAWRGDGQVVYAVSQDDTTGDTRLNMISQPIPVEASSTMLTVQPAATINEGQSVTLTAAVTSTTSGNVPWWGTITYKDNGNLVGTASLANGVASLSYSPSYLGQHSITATFAGNRMFTPSSSQPVSVFVHNGATSTSLQAFPGRSYVDPVHYPGQDVELYVVIKPVHNWVAPTGTVTFYEGSQVLGTATLYGGCERTGCGGSDASVYAYFTTPGTHHLTARYSGNSLYAPGQSPVLDYYVVVPTPI
jgi:hypothetical protein